MLLNAMPSTHLFVLSIDMSLSIWSVPNQPQFVCYIIERVTTVWLEAGWSNFRKKNDMPPSTVGPTYRWFGLLSIHVACRDPQRERESASPSLFFLTSWGLRENFSIPVFPHLMGPQKAIRQGLLKSYIPHFRWQHTSEHCSLFVAFLLWVGQDNPTRTFFPNTRIPSYTEIGLVEPERSTIPHIPF